MQRDAASLTLFISEFALQLFLLLYFLFKTTGHKKKPRALDLLDPYSPTAPPLTQGNSDSSGQVSVPRLGKGGATPSLEEAPLWC